MAILFQTENVSLPDINRRNTINWIKSVVARNNMKTGNISYIFCSDDEILRINRQYLNHDYYTDIITFDYTEGDKISGDLFISLDTVKSNSLELGTDFTEELYRVMIHGVLHLCGFKDKSLEEEAMMRSKENEALALLTDGI